MLEYILRKEQSGYFLYDIDMNKVFFSERKDDEFYVPDRYIELSYNQKTKLPDDYFKTHKGRHIDNACNNLSFSAPETVFFEVTKKCNLRCQHCFNSSGARLLDELTFEEMKDVINQMYDLGVFNVKITGGEPFQRKDIFQILKYLDDRSINFTIFTNGTDFDSRRIESLKELKNLLRVRVSIDGVKTTNDSIRGIGTFDSAMKTLKALCDSGIPCELNYTITKSNYLEISELSETLINNSIGCKINIGFVKISGRAINNNLYYFTETEIVDAVAAIQRQIANNDSVKDFHLLEPLYYKLFKDEFGCPAGRLTETIKSNGDVYACGLFSSCNDLCCGNVRDSKLIDIWKGNTISHIRSIKNAIGCEDCSFYMQTCTGACRGNALNYHGDICGKDINCYLYKVSFC